MKMQMQYLPYRH